MIPSLFTSCWFALGLISRFVTAQNCSTECQSYGLDYQNGGTYFQNVASTADFTAFEDFVGCQNDTANNILVDPQGNQYNCNSVPIQPDLTSQLITCPLEQDQMYNGEWSLVVISNNGDCDPIDNIRTFSLSVGFQATVVVPPTITLTTTTTPVIASTFTVYQTYTSSASPTTTTVPQAPKTTITRQPLPTFTEIVRGVITQTILSQSAIVVASTTTTKTAECPNFSAVLDEINTRISVTVPLAGMSKAQPTSKSQLNDHGPRWKSRSGIRSGSRQRKRAALEERGIVERHPDPLTTTIIATSEPAVTSTSTVTAPITTVTGTTTVISLTITTPTVTVNSGGGRVTTVELPQVTVTNTLWIPVTFDITTISTDVTVTSTSTVIPTSCQR